jgi:A/G-specific adenine glycosylase
MKELDAWFLQNKRDFPWRKDPTPYKVWISEVMLQQTRASVVCSYFEHWLDLFPDVFSLAKAPIEKVIKAWEGLGYYSRARNIHKAARQIVEKFNGNIPNTKEQLQQIAGLGPYTVGAILSFGYKQKAAAVDGNVMRVLSRYYCIEENICKQPVKRKITEKTLECLSASSPWVTMEAIIELGATVCRPKPACSACPLKDGCKGKSKAEYLPIKSVEKETEILKRVVLVIESEGKILLKKGAPGKVMADLYEFPYFDMGESLWSQKKIKESALRKLGLEIEIVSKLQETSHAFTRYKAYLYPYKMKVDLPKHVDGYQWIEQDLLPSLPFSSGHRRILFS